MILPTLRSSFGRDDAMQLVDLIGGDDRELEEGARARYEEHGIDALLDDPRVLNALLTEPEANASPALIFYVLVRHALLEGGIDDRATADYVASLVSAFGREKRAYRISDRLDEEYHYLVDMMVALQDADRDRAFLLQAHLGNYALWLTGLFPDYLEARMRRKGGPSFTYYERMGAGGFHGAASARQAQQLGVGEIFRGMAHRFSDVRVALNRVSDRYMHGSGWSRS